LAKKRVFTRDFKNRVVKRILDGESVSAIHQKHQIARAILYRWCETYRRDGAGGLQRPRGRPPGITSRARPPAEGEDATAQRIAELERKVGQQAMDLDFFRRAFKRVKESRRKNTEPGGTASTGKSEA
jgi:transposase